MPHSPERDDLFSSIDSDPEIGGAERDQYDRPLLVPGPERAANPLLLNRVSKKCPDGRREDGKLPYTRASSLGNYMADHSGLHTWRERSLTKGLAEREDLAALAAALPPIIGNRKSKALMTKEEIAQDRATNKALDEIAEEAAIYANRDYKANWGTAIHSFTDRVVEGEHPDVPKRMLSDVEAFAELTAGWEFLATEMFVRNDLYQAAGTFDHLVRIPWRPDLGTLIVDKKTGERHDDQVSIQMAVYALGEPYDVAADKTYDWPGGEAPNFEIALRIDIPMGLGRAEVSVIDLAQGSVAADHACAVRAHRSNKTLSRPWDVLGERRLQLAELITLAESREEMLEIRNQNLAVWHDQLNDLAKVRVKELTSR